MEPTPKSRSIWDMAVARAFFFPSASRSVGTGALDFLVAAIVVASFPAADDVWYAAVLILHYHITNFRSCQGFSKNIQFQNRNFQKDFLSLLICFIFDFSVFRTSQKSKTDRQNGFRGRKPLGQAHTHGVRKQVCQSRNSKKHLVRKRTCRRWSRARKTELPKSCFLPLQSVPEHVIIIKGTSKN